jgi:uncharacterized protein YkwD
MTSATPPDLVEALRQLQLGESRRRDAAYQAPADRCGLPALLGALVLLGLLGCQGAENSAVHQSNPVTAPRPRPTQPQNSGRSFPSRPVTHFSLSPDEKQLLDLVNQDRAKAKLAPLSAHPKLFEMARAHAINMAKTGAAKDEIDGKGTLQRLEALGYKFQQTTANLGAAADVVTMHTAWINSPAVKDGILGHYTDTGIGIAKNERNQTFFYLVLAVPSK